MLAQLIPKQGGHPVTLNRPITVIGRSSKLCDLVIDNNSVSKQHCMLVKTDGLLYLRDLGSTNGTRVNGQRVVRGALLPGDHLSLSGVTYRVHLAPDPGSGGVMPSKNLTEAIRSIDSANLEGDSTFRQPSGSQRQSKSDVRFFTESDLLMPD